jgi:hypothetical protein
VIKINEVAHLARVAPSSVSRVLNDHPDVSDEMNVLEHHRHQVLVTPRALGQAIYVQPSMNDTRVRGAGRTVRRLLARDRAAGERLRLGPFVTRRPRSRPKRSDGSDSTRCRLPYCTLRVDAGALADR